MIRWNYWNRKVHYWGSLLIALPVLVVIGSGLLLQLKKDLAWVQPPEQRRPGREPAVEFGQILEACRRVPEAGVGSWEDVVRIDVRPAKGVLKVTAASGHEVQIDQTTGEVLQVAYRRSDLIESIHDGSFFHPAAKLYVFLPAGFGLMALWLTGVYLFALPIVIRRRRGRAKPA